MLTGPQIKKYFERINYNGDAALTKETLFALQGAHVMSVPYENMDVLLNKPISLDNDDLYEKIVEKRRGGYCFELNGIFGYLLSSIGFDVRECAGRFLLNEKTIPKRRHRVLIVECGGKRFVADVGVGLVAPRYPLELTHDIIQTQGDEKYRIERDDFLGHVVMQRYRGDWQKFYSFTEEPQLPIDFEYASFYCEKHPDSPFNKIYMIETKNSEGRITLDGLRFKIHSSVPGNSLEKEIREDEAEEYLEKYFGIKI